MTNTRPRLRLINTDATPAGELSALVAELLTALRAWGAQLTELLEITERKLAALGKADVSGLHDCLQAEAGALEQVVAGEPQRRAILARLAQRLHLPSDPAPPLTKITEQLPEPEASLLRAKTQGLRAAAEKLKKKNGLAASVAQRLHSHIRIALADVANANQRPVGYGPSGRVEQRTTRSWVDAVG